MMMLKPLGGHGVPKWPREWPRDPRGCPAEGNDHARETLAHTMVWRTGASETIGFLVYFAHAPTKPKLVQDRGAPNATYTGFVDMGAFFEAMS